MTKLEALNQILNIIVESEKEGRTILEAINLTAQAYGGKGESTNNAVAIKELYDIFTDTKTQLLPINIKEGKTVLGVEGSHFGELIPSVNPRPDQLFNCVPWIKELDCRPFDASQATSMRRMFYGMSKLTRLAFPSNTGNVTDMSEMLAGCDSLTVIDFSNLDTSNVTSMDNLFESPSSSPPRIDNIILSPNWGPKLSFFDLTLRPFTNHDSMVDIFRKLADKTKTGSSGTIKISIKALLSDDEIKIATDKGWTVA